MTTQEKLRKDLQSLMDEIQLETMIFELRRDGYTVSRSTLGNFLRGMKISANTEKNLVEWMEKRKEGVK